MLTDVDFNKNTETVNPSRRQKQSDTDPQEIWGLQVRVVFFESLKIQ